MTEKGGFWKRISPWLIPGSEIPKTSGIPYDIIPPLPPRTPTYPNPSSPVHQEPSSAQGVGLPPQPSRYPLIKQMLSGPSEEELRERERVRQEALDRERYNASIGKQREQTLSHIKDTGLEDMLAYAAQVSAELSGATNYKPLKFEDTRDEWYRLALCYEFLRPGYEGAMSGIMLCSRGIGEYPVYMIDLYKWEENNEQKLQKIVADSFRNLYWERTPPPRPPRSFSFQDRTS